MGMSFGHLIVVLIIVMLLFGAGKLPNVMRDLGKGLKEFKDAMNGSDLSGGLKPKTKDEDHSDNLLSEAPKHLLLDKPKAKNRKTVKLVDQDKKRIKKG